MATGPTRDEFRFLERLRVRWAEVDMQKIVFNGHYLMYVDTAVAGYWRALAMPYHATMEALQGDLYVRKATLEYEGSARYDDDCAVGLRCTRIGNSSIVFGAAVFRGDERLVQGELVYVFADPATQRPRAVPPALRAVLEAFEAGNDIVEVRIDNWDAFGSQAAQIRRAVFMHEQRIPAALDGDALDHAALHVLVLNRFGQAVATARLVLPAGADGLARLGRVAVLQPVRGAGLGRKLVHSLVEAARARGHNQIRLDAQRSAVGFFSRAGFVAVGAAFEESGVVHQTMQIQPASAGMA
jgi:YbgC/YbaW family acyl-CoA thioester hydrolase